MCLLTNQRWPKIAWKPITTYKVVYVPDYHPSLLTLFQKFPIQIGNTYKETLGNIFKGRKKVLPIMRYMKDYIQIQDNISRE